jgi:hypothetical protein
LDILSIVAGGRSAGCAERSEAHLDLVEEPAIDALRFTQRILRLCLLLSGISPVG